MGTKLQNEKSITHREKNKRQQIASDGYSINGYNKQSSTLQLPEGKGYTSTMHQKGYYCGVQTDARPCDPDIKSAAMGAPELRGST
jgi:hypothetical protein